MSREEQSSRNDVIKWVAAITLLSAGVFCNYFYASQPLVIRLTVLLVLGAVSVIIAARTTKGAMTIDFAKQSRTELRKVVWPSRQETLQTSLVVVVMVFIVAIALWGIDSLLLSAIGMLTGHRG